jgi:hypothetical protein
MQGGRAIRHRLPTTFALARLATAGAATSRVSGSASSARIPEHWPSVRGPPSSAVSEEEGLSECPERLALEVVTAEDLGEMAAIAADDVEAERGIEVDHVTIYRWVQRFAPEFAEAARARQHLVGDRWHVDETYLKVGGTWRYLFRAIDQFGQVIDVFLSCGGTRRPRGGSSPRRSAALGSYPPRSPPTGTGLPTRPR